MTTVVTDNCRGCRFTDCVSVCPVEAFHVDDEMLYINPDVCIDCSACVPECPVEAIYEEDDLPDGQEHWVDINEGLLCKYNPDNGKNIAIDFKKPIGCFALKNNLNVILALTDGFFEFDQS